MSGSTEVFINTTLTDTQVTAAGIDVYLINNSITETIIGVPGTAGIKGVDGASGPQGDTGAGVPIGGAIGQISVKQSTADFDMSWSANYTVMPVTGWVGAGTSTPHAPVHISGDDQALVLENLQTPGTYFTICPGRSGLYEDNLIISRGTGIGNVGDYLMRFSNLGSAVFEKGISIKDGETIGSNTSGALAFLKLFDGTKGQMSFRGAGSSGKAVFEISSYYHDTTWHGVNVGAWKASSSGGQLGVNTNTPSTTLHVEGPVRIGSYTVVTLPDASTVGEGSMIYVTDETGGAVMAFCDGIDWRRMTDRIVVS